jgi:WD40 repeat protein
VVFSPDGKLLASCSTDKTTRVWDASTGKALSVLEGHADTVNKVAFSPDNRLIASCSADTTIKLWDVVTETGIGTLKGHTDTINSVAFSQDGTLLISASADTTIRLWTTDGTPRGTIRGHTLPVNTAAFSPDNKLVVSCSDDETIRLWNSEIQEAPGTTEIGVPARSMSFSQEAQGILEVGVPVREVAFSLDGQYVETDRGRLDVKALAFPATPSSPSSPRLGRSSSSLNLEVACPHTLFVVREWVRRMSEDALWLPAEYHATTVATWDDTVVLGHALGAVSFVSF